jgi:hypothetical protein
MKNFLASNINQHLQSQNFPQPNFMITFSPVQPQN